MSEETVDEVEARTTRKNRDVYLAMSDWTHKTTDRVVADKAEWALYRKKLRDLTLRPDFPRIRDSNFPQPPTSPWEEYDKWLYVESRAEGESFWQENPDWVAP
jgi:hypothetical protein